MGKGVRGSSTAGGLCALFARSMCVGRSSQGDHRRAIIARSLCVGRSSQGDHRRAIIAPCWREHLHGVCVGLLTFPDHTCQV